MHMYIYHILFIFIQVTSIACFPRQAHCARALRDAREHDPCHFFYARSARVFFVFNLFYASAGEQSASQ